MPNTTPRPRTAGLMLALSLALTAFTASRAVANCGAEGCPLTPQGPEIVLGRWSFDLAYLAIDQDRIWDGRREISAADEATSGGIGHIVELETRTRSWTLNGRMRITDRLIVSGTLPYMDRFHRHELVHHAGFFIPAEWHFKGVADAQAMVQWNALGGMHERWGALTVQAGAKLPTGRRHVEEIDGEEPEPPARLGSGSTDALVGLQWQRGFVVRSLDRREGMLPLTVGVLGRVNGTGTESYRMGNELQVSLSASYPIVRRVSALAQVNASSHGRDVVGNTDADPHHTGSQAVFFTPGLRVELGAGLSLFAYDQVRVYQFTNGPQLGAPQRFLVGTAFSPGR